MAHAATIPARRPFWLRVFHNIPVIGWIAYDVEHKGPENIYYGLFLIFSLWALAVVLFGIPGLVIPALLKVPLVFAWLIMISLPVLTDDS